MKGQPLVNPSATVFVALCSGVFGWWFTNFIFHPWKEVQELRRKSRFEIIYWENFSSETAAGEAFRKVAFELLALNETSAHWFRKLLQLMSYDLAVASNGMIGLSHTIGEDQDYLYRAICRHRVEKALALQLEFSDEDYERIYARWKLNQDLEDNDYHPDPIDELLARFG
jgi:hypothetical protein